MKVRQFKKIIIVLVSLLFSVEGHSHARIKANSVTPPRNNNAGLKSGPCGGIARTATPATLTAGDTIELEWEETVQHPGRYEFSISLANDQSFIQLLIVPDLQDNAGDLPHQYKAFLTVPSITCEDCTLQMIQVMTENPASPRNYYSCADIRIINGNPVPTPTPVVTPVPTATPTPTPIPTPIIVVTPTPIPTPIIVVTPTPIATPIIIVTPTPVATVVPTPIVSQPSNPPSINSPDPDDVCTTN